MARSKFISRMFLGFIGAVIGLVLWVLTGQVLVDLGIIARFDPFYAAEDPPPHTSLSRTMEWSFAVFVPVGAILTPWLLGWLTKPNESR